MTTHSTLSPSKRHRWGACPGSVREERAYPEERSGTAAIDGTHSHSLLDHCVKAGLADPKPMIGIKMSDHDGEFIVDEGRAERVKVAIDYITEQSLGGLVPVLAEQRVDPAWLLSRTDLGGTVDVQIHGEVWEIIDYKDGMADAWDSAILQMEQYAVGALAGLKIPVNLPYPMQTVRLTVIQPKLALKGMPAVRSQDYTVERMLNEVAKTIVLQAAATDAPDAPLVPGEKQCRYCKHKGSCAALAGQALSVIDAGDLSVSAADKDPTKMSDDQIVRILEAAPLMRQLIDGVEKEAQTRLENGATIPGLKLVLGKGARSWKLPEAEMAEKLVKMGIPKGEVYEEKLVSPAKAEKLKWKKRDGTEVQLTPRQLATMDKEYVVKTTGKPTLALASDSRAAVTVNAAPLFSAVQPPEPPVELPAWLL
jgi:hypothetical protein